MTLPDQDNPNRDIFNTRYSSQDLSLHREGMLPYDREMIELRLELLRRYGVGKEVLDLCCGTGSYLRQELPNFSQCVGVDFSRNLLSVCKQKLGGQIPENLILLECDARQVALRSGSVDLVFSFTSLYTVPQVETAIAEIGRVLRPGGFAVFELGNLWSLNTHVCREAHRRQGVAKGFHIPYPAMSRMIQDAHLTILERRMFQILPMWGGGAFWLRPLTNWRWKWLMGINICGRMLDEWLSSMWPLRFVAFRHLFVCQKTW